MESLAVLGVFLLAGSVAGKQSLRFYQQVMNRTAFGASNTTMMLGRYYQGGFESPMTRREAALILGIRESAEEKKILEVHRKLMLLNHPDNGGSTFIATKINEAKELLSSGKSSSGK
ncbi:UNKNOWN [Stylonychia lemnae]|uniref:J domain-containing protein n=1 Tax=Stylonychia lemnae TaxID=5949 RepID=A0A077ZTT1_STYLE|nr:UNKNOWN [Stylonychia lemnae]|eukprot:CDW72969.1 UNKNOWN [Stylonychia lemnae]